MPAVSSTYHTCIDFGDDEALPVTVAYSYYPLSRGTTDGRYGPKIEPDEPAHVEIDSIKSDDGAECEVSEDEINSLEAEIMDHLTDQENDWEPEFDEGD